MENWSCIGRNTFAERPVLLRALSLAQVDPNKRHTLTILADR